MEEDWHQFANWEDCVIPSSFAFGSTYTQDACAGEPMPKHPRKGQTPLVLSPRWQTSKVFCKKMQLSLYAMHCGQLTYASISFVAQREGSYIEVLPLL